MQMSFNYNSHKLLLNQKVRRVVPKPKLLSVEIYRNSSVLRKAKYMLFFFLLVRCFKSSFLLSENLESTVFDYTNLFGHTLYFMFF